MKLAAVVNTAILFCCGEYARGLFLILKYYSRVPNNRLPPIVNFSIFFHPGHLYSNPPIINFQSFLLTFFECK